MPRSACSVAMETYHGASTIILRILIDFFGMDFEKEIKFRKLHWQK
jgi:hypothetical protein